MTRARASVLHVRMSEEERERLDQLATEYGMDTSTFVRHAFRFIDYKRPDLVLPPEGKEKAPTHQMPVTA